MTEAAEGDLVKEANAAAVVLEVAATSPLVRDFDRHEAARRADLFRRLVAALSRAEAERDEFRSRLATQCGMTLAAWERAAQIAEEHGREYISQPCAMAAAAIREHAAGLSSTMMTFEPHELPVGGGETEALITPPMVSAGLAALDAYRDSFPEEQLVAAVYSAMRSVAVDEASAEKPSDRRHPFAFRR